MLQSPYIECAKVINTHGCHGGIKLESWCNSSEDLANLKTIYFQSHQEFVPYSVVKASLFKQFVLLELKGVTDMDQALALKGKIAYALRDDFSLQDGEYFLADLIGLDVIDSETGVKYGTLVETINRGASDIYVVATPNGERMVPAVSEFVERVNIQQGIFIKPIEGMMN